LAKLLPTENDPTYEVKIPNTDIRIGVYRIEDGRTRNLVFKIGSRAFYLSRKSPEQELPRPVDTWDGGYDINGPVGYGLYDDYLVIDWDAGGSGSSTEVFLFRYTSDSMTYLDSDGGSGRVRVLEEIEQHSEDWKNPSWTKIEDVDGDGYAEIMFIDPKSLVLEIRQGELLVDLSPIHYRDRCKDPEPPRGPYTGWDYVFCNFVAGTLRLDDIKPLLANGLSDRSFQDYVKRLDRLKNASQLGVDSDYEKGFVIKEYDFGTFSAND
jgi:hypothetical protein